MKSIKVLLFSFTSIALSLFLLPLSVMGASESVLANSDEVVEQIELIKSSSSHTMALTNLGNVYSAGDNSNGQLGPDTYLLIHLFHFALIAPVLMTIQSLILPLVFHIRLW